MWCTLFNKITFCGSILLPHVSSLIFVCLLINFVVWTNKPKKKFPWTPKMYTQRDNPRIDESRRSRKDSFWRICRAIVNKLYFNNTSSRSKSHGTSGICPHILSAIEIFLSAGCIPGNYFTFLKTSVKGNIVLFSTLHKEGCVNLIGQHIRQSKQYILISHL